MALSEIEKLERRYAENPQGLTFAPLAEVHRKNGDVARALELLHPGLQVHPDYIPARIVLGRCHLDFGDLPAAETAFSHVLALDGENVIALKALADIQERLHHFDQAERWLHQLLSVDRSNDEARAQLGRIETARAQAAEAAARSAEPEPALAVPPEVEPSPERDEELSPASVAGPGAENGSDDGPLALEELEHTSLGSEVDEPAPLGLVVEEVEQVEATVEPLRGLIGRDVAEPEEAFLVETGEDIILRSSGGSEFQVPDASLELSSGVIPAEPSPFGPDLRQFESSSEPAASEPAASEPATSEPATSEPAYSESTYAERTDSEPAYSDPTYSEPTYSERADSEPSYPEPTYSEPLLPRPEPGTVAEPKWSPAPEPVAAEEATVTATEPESPRRAFAAPDTKGESVADFFQRMLAARPPGVAGAPVSHAAPASASDQPDAGGAPTRPAADALSLSSVFGEETTAAPPAVSAAGAPAAGVTFDEFFSPPGAATGARAPRSPDARNDDLDQFHAWLQNLKR